MTGLDCVYLPGAFTFGTLISPNNSSTGVRLIVLKLRGQDHATCHWFWKQEQKKLNSSFLCTVYCIGVHLSKDRLFWQSDPTSATIQWAEDCLHLVFCFPCLLLVIWAEKAAVSSGKRASWTDTRSIKDHFPRLKPGFVRAPEISTRAKSDWSIKTIVLQFGFPHVYHNRGVQEVCFTLEYRFYLTTFTYIE